MPCTVVLEACFIISFRLQRFTAPRNFIYTFASGLLLVTFLPPGRGLIRSIFPNALLSVGGKDSPESVSGEMEGVRFFKTSCCCVGQALSEKLTSPLASVHLYIAAFVESDTVRKTTRNPISQMMYFITCPFAFAAKTAKSQIASPSIEDIYAPTFTSIEGYLHKWGTLGNRGQTAFEPWRNSKNRGLLPITIIPELDRSGLRLEAEGRHHNGRARQHVKKWGGIPEARSRVPTGSSNGLRLQTYTKHPRNISLEDLTMSKYLIQASYTAAGAKGLIKDGGTKRRETVKGVIEGLGGKLEAFYYAFGKDDVIAIADLPDHAAAAAISLTVGATGTVGCKTTVLLSPEEMDEATQKSVSYTPPGQ